MQKTITLTISGLGFIVYSAFAIEHISEGENYLEAKYWQYEDMIKHVKAGSLVGFATSSPGSYQITFSDNPIEGDFEFNLKVGIEVRDSYIYIRDLYDLLKWNAECPENQKIELANGFYKLHISSNLPKSGIIGDDQEIYIFAKKVDKLPHIDYDDVPTLCF